MTHDPHLGNKAHGSRPARFTRTDAHSFSDATKLPLLVHRGAIEVGGMKAAERCKGLFYACAGGAEARRFNRLLIDAGLIKGL